MSQLKRINVHENKQLTAGSVLTFNVPSYDTIDDIMLRFSNSGAAATVANIKSAIERISLNINGEQVINLLAERLYDIYAMLGNEVYQGTPGNVISLNLSRLIFKAPENENFFAWGCANIQTIQVQVYCATTITGVTDVELLTERRAFSSTLGSYIKAISYPQTMASTGTSTVDTLPRDSNEAYLAIMTHNGGGVISTGECVVNGSSVIDPIAQAVNDYVVKSRGFASVTGYFNYFFADGSVQAFLPMMGVTELRLKTSFTTAPTNSTYDMVALTIKNVPQTMLDAFSK